LGSQIDPSKDRVVVDDVPDGVADVLESDVLALVPMGMLFLYPYVAFHDGFKAPNMVGLVLGLLLAFGPLPGQIAMVETLTQQAQEVAQSRSLVLGAWVAWMLTA
jgi:hypothetical protein